MYLRYVNKVPDIRNMWWKISFSKFLKIHILIKQVWKMQTLIFIYLCWNKITYIPHSFKHRYSLGLISNKIWTFGHIPAIYLLWIFRKKKIWLITVKLETCIYILFFQNKNKKEKQSRATVKNGKVVLIPYFSVFPVEFGKKNIEFKLNYLNNGRKNLPLLSLEDRSCIFLFIWP